MKIFYDGMDIMTMFWHRRGYHIRFFGSIKLYLLGIYKILDLVFKGPVVVGVMPRTVRVVGTLCILIIVRRGGVGVLKRIP